LETVIQLPLYNVLVFVYFPHNLKPEPLEYLSLMLLMQTQALIKF